ncbi:MAG: hypothetical protein JJE04_00040 [Acidobacteriia bacterium]|nr:hypothetical protein [Terriglobia bacterium]
MPSASILILLAALISIGAPVGASAATLEKLSLDEMAQKSTEIVLGRVREIRYRQRGSIIYTVAKVQVTERWKGVQSGLVEVNVPGGISGGLRQVFPGSPQFLEGYEYVFFLWTGRTGVTQVIGLSQGLFDLKSDSKGQAQVYRGASTETVLDKTGKQTTDGPLQMSLDQMRTFVRNALGKAAQ